MVDAGRVLSFRVDWLEVGQKAEACLVIQLSVFVLSGQRRVLAGDSEGSSKPENRGLLMLEFRYTLQR